MPIRLYSKKHRKSQRAKLYYVKFVTSPGSQNALNRSLCYYFPKSLFYFHSEPSTLMQGLLCTLIAELAHFAIDRDRDT